MPGAPSRVLAPSSKHSQTHHLDQFAVAFLCQKEVEPMAKKIRGLGEEIVHLDTKLVRVNVCFIICRH